MKDFRQMKQCGEKITALTAYDYPTARLLDETGIDIILVGDSLGMVVLGYRDTTPVTLEEMLHHTRAAARGIKQALLVADMPIHTYDTPEQAIATAKKFVDAGAQAVKLEGGASHIAQIEAITQEGIPFMAHIGMLPQSVREEGGYRIKGRTQSEAEALLADARAVEKAGAFSVVLEIVFADVAREEHMRLGPNLLGRSIVGARFRNIWPCADGHVSFAIQGGPIGRHTGRQMTAWMAGRPCTSQRSRQRAAKSEP